MSDQLLHHNIDAAASQYPERDAFHCGQHAITYQTLARRTSQLAACLREHGVRNGDRVGIRLSPSLESAVAVYGILKAGAAFVPIDPNAPVERLGRIIHTGNIRHLVTHGTDVESQDRLFELCPALKCLIGPLQKPVSGPVAVSWSDVQAFPAESPPCDISPNDSAYVIFTSGSTGTPKGIVHTHFSGQSYARLSAATYGVGAEDRVANLSPLHFDMSTFGYLSAPLAGATTVLVPDAYLKLPASLSQLLESEKVTIWYSVPFLLSQLLERGALDRRNLTALRWVMFGGEPFPPGQLHRLMKLLPNARFSNVYGPAEVNQCTRYHVPPITQHSQVDQETSAIPIGRVWEETESLVVDTIDCAVDDGDAGELLIHSSTMMQSYWDRPATDCETFLIVPCDSGSKKFYRTGDMVRRDENGDLVFLGRRDRQIKIRGYRVELDEVEHILASHPNVIEAAVFRSVDVNVPSLAAVAIVGQQSVSVESLRRFLARKLPSYVVPATIEIRESLPRTTTGKIDRRQLQLCSPQSHSD
jgi:L-proline---[L-prolyl-carrier protein] ligase